MVDSQVVTRNSREMLTIFNFRVCVSAAERLRKGVGELLGRVTLRVSWQQPVADWSVCVCVCF